MNDSGILLMFGDLVRLPARSEVQTLVLGWWLNQRLMFDPCNLVLVSGGWDKAPTLLSRPGTHA